jgi:hypothetical protein
MHLLCKAAINRGSKPVMFQYVIGDSDLERVDVINNLGVLVDNSNLSFLGSAASLRSLVA